MLQHKSSAFVKMPANGLGSKNNNPLTRKSIDASGIQNIASRNTLSVLKPTTLSPMLASHKMRTPTMSAAKVNKLNYEIPLINPQYNKIQQAVAPRKMAVSQLPTAQKRSVAS